jgi:HEPN domain-containing protein
MDANSLKRKRISAFLEIAQRDLRVAKALLPDSPEAAAFNIQQSAEKQLRAVLEHEVIVLGKTHSLRELANLLPPGHRWREPFLDIDHVSSGATRYRYPTSSGNIVEADGGAIGEDLASVEQLYRDVSAWLSFRTT